GVSKETKSALGSFVNYSEKSSKILEKMRINHGEITQKESQELTNLNKKMSDDLIEQMNKRKDKELKIAHDVLDKSTAISEEDKKRILKKTEERNEIAIKKTQELNRKIKEIEDKRNNSGKLSDKEIRELQSLYKQREEVAVKALTNGEKEQKRVLARISINRKAASIAEASEIVKEANKARDDAKKDAKKRYDDKIDEINSIVGLSQKEREKLLDEAKKKYDKDKKLADENHESVMRNLKKSNKNIEAEIDLSNGKVYNGFQKWWHNIKEGHFSLSKHIKKSWYNLVQGIFGAIDSLKGIGNKIGQPFSKAKDFIVSSSKDIYQGVTHWFENTKNSIGNKISDMKEHASKKWGAISNDASHNAHLIYSGTSKWMNKAFSSMNGWLSDMKNSALKKWDAISSVAWSNAKSVWRGTSKWFGDAYSSLKSWVGDMYESAFDKFDSISSSAWSNAKSVYNGFKTWLSNTLDWIKEIGGEMADAAADLGKSVANKAIGGLNSMIGGINSISKAITDKDLIKPIPTLSTGTMASPSVSTDSNGGLTAPTLAIVNDRGVGNAPGGGVQEIIHRANGTLEAPQGRNVLVSLGVGDSVINANDTQRYQRMGVIPSFSTGTKKKDWLENMVSSIGKFGSKAKDTFHNIKTGAKEMIKAAGDKIKDGASWLSEKVGDVWDYIENPGKLVSKVMDSLGISFGEGNHATIKMAKGAFNILKTKLIDKVKSWFEEFGGGDGSYLFNYPIWQRFGSYTGGLGFNGGRHYGMDFGMPAGTKVYAVKGGIVDNVWYDYGGGNSIQIKTGPGEWNWYMHLSKQLVRLGEHIRTGQLIAESGATGAYCKGAHLHFQLMRGDHPGNDTAIDPESYLKSLKGAAGGNGADAARSAILKAQAILGGNYRSSYITEQMMRVAKRESNYTSNAVNDWDINAQMGDPSKGMFQMIGSTFRTYAKSGFGNIMNPVDEAISAMRYIVDKYGWNGFKRAGDYAYENGGLITKHQIAEIGEGNKPEMIIPLTKRSRAIKLIEDAMRIVGMDTSSSNVTVNQDNSTVEKLLNHIAILTDTGNKLTRMLIETVKPNQQNNSLNNVEQTLSKISATRALALNYMEGGLDI
ncbi:peptidoglycan DD-metalloendopeptidase family protein, partial [Staphylococcus haemolyticus]